MRMTHNLTIFIILFPVTKTHITDNKRFRPNGQNYVMFAQFLSCISTLISPISKYEKRDSGSHHGVCMCKWHVWG